MDFGLSAAQEALRDEVISFARADLAHDLVKGDQAGEFSRAAWEACARFGLLGLATPAAHGGRGLGALDTMVAMEALGYACADNGLVFAMNAQMWAVQYPIARFGTDEQRDRYLPGLCSGELIGAHCTTEPASGSDAFSLATTAAPDGDSLVLSGRKTLITNAPVADVFLVLATEDPAKGFAGLNAYLVDRGTPGLEVGPPVAKMGLRTCAMGEVTLDGCRVPATARLGRPNGGMAVFTALMERERSMILAPTVGTMARLLERSVDRARRRTQFGSPIGKFQAVSHRLVEMKLRLETARLLLHRLGWLIDQGRPAALDAALVKLHLSESVLHSALDTLQVHGGEGYLVDTEVEREVRDAVGGRLYSGTSEIQKNLVARLMGL